MTSGLCLMTADQRKADHHRSLAYPYVEAAVWPVELHDGTSDVPSEPCLVAPLMVEDAQDIALRDMVNSLAVAGRALLNKVDDALALAEVDSREPEVEEVAAGHAVAEASGQHLDVLVLVQVACSNQAQIAWLRDCGRGIDLLAARCRP